MTKEHEMASDRARVPSARGRQPAGPVVGGFGVPAASVFALVAALVFATAADAQLRASYSYGSGISPAFEGWIPRDDGSYDIVFGYMNRNWEEQLHIPIGPENYISFVGVGDLDEVSVDGFDGAEADQGQPTYFQPRRNRFMFNVRVPADFAASGEEVVWTLTANGSTERAYGSLARDYMIDNIVIMSETGALGAGTSDDEVRNNVPPVIEVEGPLERTVAVGEPLELLATVTDDGVPTRRGTALPADEAPEELLRRALNPPRRVTVGKINGLYYSWSVYRGAGEAVAFDPPQVKTWEDTRAFANSPWAFFWSPPEPPEDDLWRTTAVFDRPGTYVLRGRADDGGLFSDVEITVRVTERAGS